MPAHTPTKGVSLDIDWRAGPTRTCTRFFRRVDVHRYSRGRATRAATAPGVWDNSFKSALLSSGGRFDSRTCRLFWPCERLFLAGIAYTCSTTHDSGGNKDNHDGRGGRAVQTSRVRPAISSPGRRERRKTEMAGGGGEADRPGVMSFALLGGSQPPFPFDAGKALQ